MRAERWLNAVFFSEYGVGKTYLAATAEDSEFFRDVLYIDAEGGDLTLQNRPELDVVRIEKYRDMESVKKFLQAHIKARDEGDEGRLLELDKWIRDPEKEPRLRKYRTVVIDSLSEVYRYCMYQLTGVQIARTNLDVEPDKAGWDEYGKSTDMIRLLVRTFRDLPVHVIFLCSEKVDDKKSAPIQLNLPKALMTEVPGFVDVVGYLAAGQSANPNQGATLVRRLYIQPNGKFLAKNRFTGFTKPYIEDPTMSKLEELVKKG